MVEEGKPAPDFELTSDTGEQVKLSSLRGKPVVLYFYPKDDTPGCTTQACGIRDAYADFASAARSSSASAPTTRPRTSSSRRSTRSRSPCWPIRSTRSPSSTASGRSENLYGKKSMGIERSTFVIDADGNVAKVMRRVKPDTHAADVLATLP